MANESSSQHGNDNPTRTGNRLLYVALACFFLGVAAIVAIVLTPVLTDKEPGLVLYLLAFACPVGFLLAIVFALRSGRRVRGKDRL